MNKILSQPKSKINSQMNGQDRSHQLVSNSVAGGTATVVSSNGAPSGAVNSQSWLRDMVADPSIAAQAGIINPRHDTQTSLSNPPTLDASNHSSRSALNRFPYNPLLHSFYNSSSNGTTGIPSSFPHAMQNIGDRTTAPQTITSSLSADVNMSSNQQRLLIASSCLPPDSLGSRPPFSLPHKVSHRDTLSTSKSPAMSESGHSLSAKRSKITDETSSAGQSSTLAFPPHLVAPPIPHRPDYFHKGSVIQLSEQKLRRIEDLQTADFEHSANISPNLSLDSSTVVKIVEDKMRGTAFLTFNVGDRPRQKQVEATVEATVEHPFFVYDRGWSSVSPEKSLKYYKMSCRQLNVYDRCISLTFKDNMSITASSQGASFGVQNSSSSQK